VNRVLEKGPDFANALFLKAPILWEGFGQAYAIKIQKVEKSVQTMTAELCRINDKLIQKK
jgi:hypothetical protein